MKLLDLIKEKIETILLVVLWLLNWFFDEENGRIAPATILLRVSMVVVVFLIMLLQIK